MQLWYKYILYTIALPEGLWILDTLNPYNKWCIHRFEWTKNDYSGCCFYCPNMSGTVLFVMENDLFSR